MVTLSEKIADHGQRIGRLEELEEDWGGGFSGEGATPGQGERRLRQASSVVVAHGADFGADNSAVQPLLRAVNVKYFAAVERSTGTGRRKHDTAQRTNYHPTGADKVLGPDPIREVPRHGTATAGCSEGTFVRNRSRQAARRRRAAARRPFGTDPTRRTVHWIAARAGRTSRNRSPCRPRNFRNKGESATYEKTRNDGAMAAFERELYDMFLGQKTRPHVATCQ